MQVEVDLDDTQVSEVGGKRWKHDDVAQEMLAACAEDAASKATKELVSLMMKDAEQREERLVERDKRLMEHLDVVAKGISDSLEGRVTNLEAKIQNQWTTFEKTWEKKIVEPDSKDCTSTLVEHRIRISVQTEMEKIRKERMEKEDKITTNKYETLHSQVDRLSEEIVGLKNRHSGSAASTVAGSSGSGGSRSNCAAHVMPNTFVPTRVELKGWAVGCRTGTCIVQRVCPCLRHVGESLATSTVLPLTVASIGRGAVPCWTRCVLGKPKSCVLPYVPRCIQARVG